MGLRHKEQKHVKVMLAAKAKCTAGEHAAFFSITRIFLEHVTQTCLGLQKRRHGGDVWQFVVTT